MTDAFYREYARRFKEIKERIKNENPAIAAFTEPDRLHTFTQRLFGRLMFLYFLQKKGALNNNPDFLKRWYVRALEDHENFYRHVLEPLFFQTLNMPRPEGHSPLFGHIPYLNGGLFAEDEDDHKGTVFLDNAIFDANGVDGLLYFLGAHNFTIEEDTPLEVEVALDPEMLGKVFENLLAEDERGRSGTFYTPRAVVSYMCREALAAYLARATTISPEQLEWLLEEAETGEPVRDDAGHERLTGQSLARPLRESLDRALDAVRVLDPAVGSGAFPLGMLALLVGVRRALFRVAGVPVQAQTDLVEGWKRNFIRDCLYGVDIKREAIEIARLRLWLSLVVDANPFTMEPLPNLDYKLMDGDSLIETFDGVEIYPTRPAIGEQQSRFGNEATEALKQQLHRMQNAYFQPGDADRQQLKTQIRETEYAIVNERLQEREAALKDRFNKLTHALTMLQGRQETRNQRAEIEAIAHEQAIIASTRADLQSGKTLPFFLFRLHFASVFAEKDGFDIVIANPPYVRHERVAPATLATLRAAYPEVQHGMADLYTYFYARALQLLHTNGTLAFITSNKFFRAGYGDRLRTTLTTQTHARTIIDFGDAPVFDAAAYPCIVITGQGVPAPDHAFRGLTVTRTQIHDQKDLDHLRQVVQEFGQTLAQAEGVRPPASSPETEALVAKLMQRGTPLGEFVQGKIYYGIKTGLNGAFVIDQATRDRLVAEDPASAEVIKPFLRGRDIGRYAVHSEGKWLIFTRQGTDIERYPAIKAHLMQWHEKLEPEPRGWVSPPEWLGRKRGTYKWFEIQDSVDYYPVFEQPKIVWPNLCLESKFSYAEDVMYVCAPANILAAANKSLLAILNSSLIWYVLRQIAIERGGTYIEAKPIYVSQLPIVEPTSADRARLEELVEALQAIGGQGSDAAAMEREVDAIVYRTYGLTTDEIAEIERWHAERRAQLATGRGRGNRAVVEEVEE